MKQIVNIIVIMSILFAQCRSEHSKRPVRQYHEPAVTEVDTNNTARPKETLSPKVEKPKEITTRIDVFGTDTLVYESIVVNDQLIRASIMVNGDYFMTSDSPLKHYGEVNSTDPAPKSYEEFLGEVINYGKALVDQYKATIVSLGQPIEKEAEGRWQSWDYADDQSIVIRKSAETFSFETDDFNFRTCSGECPYGFSLSAGDLYVLSWNGTENEEVTCLTDIDPVGKVLRAYAHESLAGVIAKYIK